MLAFFSAAPEAVEKLRLVRVDVGDQLHRGHLWSDAVFDVQTQALQHDAAGLEHRRLVVRMDLEHAEFALDDLRTGFGLSRLDRDIHRAENFVAGRHLDIQRGHALGRQVALGHGTDKCRILRLHAIQVTVTTQ
jgi:hypothetical protein